MPNSFEKELLTTLKGLQQQLAMQATPGIELINATDKAVPPQNVAREDWQWVVFHDVVPANGQWIQAQIVGQESHFDLIYLTGYCDHRDLEIRIHDTGSDRYLGHLGAWISWRSLIGDTAAINLTNLGTPNAPYTLVGRRRFPAGSQISLELRETGGNDTVFELAMHGIKVFAQYEK